MEKEEWKKKNRGGTSGGCKSFELFSGQFELVRVRRFIVLEKLHPDNLPPIYTNGATIFHNPRAKREMRNPKGHFVSYLQPWLFHPLSHRIILLPRIVSYNRGEMLVKRAVKRGCESFARLAPVLNICQPQRRSAFTKAQCSTCEILVRNSVAPLTKLIEPALSAVRASIQPVHRGPETKSKSLEIATESTRVGISSIKFSISSQFSSQKSARPIWVGMGA